MNVVRFEFGRREEEVQWFDVRTSKSEETRVVVVVLLVRRCSFSSPDHIVHDRDESIPTDDDDDDDD